jgi:hypothetical protein
VYMRTRSRNVMYGTRSRGRRQPPISDGPHQIRVADLRTEDERCGINAEAKHQEEGTRKQAEDEKERGEGSAG